ncbi:helix-hairpin-helix domain-containing protein [Roseateles sp. MS654]|uniref:helix-hairpin-helix domain-containing protein n=1 Tax=Roseateles sp. MS654 TaxID=3412685 RepID=UPI003C3087CC
MSSSTGPKRAPRASAKATTAAECRSLREIPNIGPAMVRDFEALGIHEPTQLTGADAYALYRRICILSGKRQDPCVLDTYMAAVDFMNGVPARPWWTYTAQRKRDYPDL